MSVRYSTCENDPVLEWLFQIWLGWVVTRQEGKPSIFSGAAGVASSGREAGSPRGLILSHSQYMQLPVSQMAHLGNSYRPVNWQRGSLEISLLRLRKPWGVPFSEVESHRGSEHHVKWKKQISSLLQQPEKTELKGEERTGKMVEFFSKGLITFCRIEFQAPHYTCSSKSGPCFSEGSLMWL